MAVTMLTIFMSIAVLLASLVLTNVIVLWMKKKQFERVQVKSSQLGRGATAPAVKVTVVTGFLGAGKTTLLNYVLNDPNHGLKIAVIENEFGSVAIDHALVKEQTHGKSNDTTIFLMKNGCMCCSGDSPGLELERVLDKLISLLEFAQASGSAKAFDHVIIETTGLADPAPIVSLLFRYSTQRAAHFALNGVVTLVDAKNIQRHLSCSGFRALADEAEVQLAYADMVLLNKADTVTATQLSELQQRVRAVNSTALIVPTEHAKVNLKKVLELNRSCDRVIAPQSECSHAYGHHASHAGHGRQDGTISICFDFTEEGAQHDDAPEDEGAERVYVGNCALKFARFQEWLRGLVEDHQQNLFRVKGVLAIEGEPARLVVQGVHADIRAQAGSAWAVSTTDGILMARSSRLVLIGKGIAPHAKNIRQSFEACLVENPSRDPSSLRNKKIL